jgi:hypothetical protein
MLDEYPDAGNYNVNPKVFVFMKIKTPKTKKERKRLDYNAKIISLFIENLGIRNEVYNFLNKHYIAIISYSNHEKIDRDFFLSHFGDLIEDLSIKSPDIFKKQNHDNQLENFDM